MSGDRKTLSGNLPAEFAERASDPVDFADQLAWSRARNRYQPGGRYVPKITHVLLDVTRHFLVVDGTRGPVCEFAGAPATHPAGFMRYRSDAYGVPPMLLGQLLCISKHEVEEREQERPAEVSARWVEFARASQAAIDEVIARYPEAK